MRAILHSTPSAQQASTTVPNEVTKKPRDRLQECSHHVDYHRGPPMPSNSSQDFLLQFARPAYPIHPQFFGSNPFVPFL